MSKSQQVIVIWVIGAAAWAMPADRAQAGPFLDWLLGRPIYTYAPATYAPATYAPSTTTANYAPSHPVVTVPPAPYATVPRPSPSYAAVSGSAQSYAAAPGYGLPPAAATYASAASSPVSAAYAPTASCCPPVTANYVAPMPVGAAESYPTQATIANYPAPSIVGAYTPSYRTTWFRVPISYYRPVTVYQGMVAPSAPMMQPCNTYAWQVQRVPTLFRNRPWLPAVAPVQYPSVYVPPASQPAWGSFPPAVSTPAVPLQPTTAGPFASPESTIPGSSAFPMAPGGFGPVPADQPPALPLGSVPNSAMTTPPPASEASNHRPPPSAANSVYQVKPIPVPELKHDGDSDRTVAPPLLNNPARNRTASQPSVERTTVTPAVWKAPPTSPTQPPSSPRHAAKQPKLWNDSGWHSAR